MCILPSFSLFSQAFASLKDIWNAFVPNEAQVWTKFYLYWLEQSKQLPIMMVRYEDILQDEKMWVQRMVAFLESGNPPLAHRWKNHWNDYLSNAVRPVDGAGYKPKKVLCDADLATTTTPATLLFSLFLCCVGIRLSLGRL